MADSVRTRILVMINKSTKALIIFKANVKQLLSFFFIFFSLLYKRFFKYFNFMGPRKYCLVCFGPTSMMFSS